MAQFWFLPRDRKGWRFKTACLAGLLIPAAAGCTRRHYRLQADNDTYAAIAESTCNPRYAVPEFNVYPDPRSRFYDPTDPDSPPMPPDDPESHRYMECVYGMRGARGWDRFGNLPDVEFPTWRAYLEADGEGEVEVDLEKVVGLARIHSREFQSQIETLYLSALDVTFERFRFDAQLFGGNETNLTLDGPIRGGGDSSSILATRNALEVQKLYAAGGQLVAGIANSILVQFAGPNSTSRTSLMTFAFTQPLMQFGGRAVILERLTRAERALLSNVRQFERYRQGFYLQLATQRANGGGLSRAGGFFGGAGLEGFSGVGGGGFGRVGTFGAGGAAGNFGGGGVAPGSVGGFIGILQQLQLIRLQEANVVGLRDTWTQLEAGYDAGRIDRFQVDFARQQYYTAQSQLLGQKADLQSTLDQYKIDLGLPPDLPFRINDPMLDQFRLIDDEATALQNSVADVLDDLRATEVLDDPTVEGLLQRMQDLQSRSVSRLDFARGDCLRLEELVEPRRASLVRLGQMEEVGRGDIDRRALDPEQPSRESVQILDDLHRLEADLGELGQRLEALRAPAENVETTRTDLIQLATDLSGLLMEVTLIQARARLHAIDVIHISIDEEFAFLTAMSNRPDWMNAKAALIDTWRLMRFNANFLQSGLNVTLLGDVGTVGNNPFDFRTTNGQLFAGIEFDAPLTRVAERNQYRQSLIEYQQQRRSLMEFRDQIRAGLRARLRQIRLDQINLELRRTAVDVAIRQVDQARLKMNEPPKPAANANDAPAAASPTTARDTVDALDRLLTTQNNLLNVWVDYLLQRMLLDFDMGTMRLDERGMWIDPGAISPNSFHGFDVDPEGGEIPPEQPLPELPSPEEVPANAS